MPELYGPLDSLAARRAVLEQRRASLLAAARKATPMPEGQMISGHFVAPHWAAYLPGLVDKFQNGMEQRAIDEATLAQGVAEKAALRDALGGLSGSPEQAATPFGSRDEPRQDATPAVPPASGMDRRQLIASLIDNPAAGALGGELLKDELIQAPIRAEARDFKKQEAEAMRLERGDQLAADRLARAELAKQRSEDLRLTLAQREQAAREHNALMRELAAMRISAQRDIASMKADDKAKEKPVKLTAAQQKAYDDADALLGHIDNALGLVKANPNAVGFKTVVPDIALAKIDPEGVQTRAATAGLSAERVHQLSGAAVSPAEFARLRPYLPANGDNAATVQDKLTNLRAEVERIKAVHARGPTFATPAGAGSSSKPPAGISLPPGFKYVGPAQ